MARAYRARRIVKVPRLTVRAKLGATSLGPETHQSTTRPMATCHLLRRKSIHALPDQQLDQCSKTGGEAMNKDLHMVMWLTEAIMYMYG